MSLFKAYSEGKGILALAVALKLMSRYHHVEHVDKLYQNWHLKPQYLTNRTVPKLKNDVEELLPYGFKL